MENEESIDNEINFYQNNIPKDYNNNNHNNIFTYSDIFNSRDNFCISFNVKEDNKINLVRKSLYKISTLIDINPEDYISFINYQEENKFDNLNLFQNKDNFLKSNNYNNDNNIEENKNFEDDEKNKNENNNDNDDNDTDIDEGFKRVDNLEDNLFDYQIYKQGFCFYLFLSFCAFWDFLFYFYIVAVTVHKSHFYTIYTLILSSITLFTGIFGAIKCKNRNFSGYPLKICTFLVPIFVIIGIIIYLSCGIKFKLFWVKVIIDIITLVISIILILYITGIIKAKLIQYRNTNNNGNEIAQNLVSNYKNISNEDKDIVVKF